MLKPELSTITKYYEPVDGIYIVQRGSPTAEHRLWVHAGTHGNEIAGPLGLTKLLKEEWRWENVQLFGVIQDPAGYEDEGYGFTDARGDGASWPPLWGYRQNDEMFWFHVDENSTWGNTAIIPERHKAMRKLMEEYDPTFVLSLHETIRSETRRDLFWVGAGILTIETWPIDGREFVTAIDPLGSPSSNLLEWLVYLLYDWLRPLFGIPRWKLAIRNLKENPHYQLTTKIAERFEEIGGELASRKWTKYLEHFKQPLIGKGRLLHGPEFALSDWLTLTDYAVAHFGCPGVTTETFPVGDRGLRGIEDRTNQQYLYTVAVWIA